MGGENVLKLEKIFDRIKEMRYNLSELGIAKGLADPEVLAFSQELDAVINEYYRLLKIKNEHHEELTDYVLKRA